MEKQFYEMHRSEAIQILLGKDKLAGTRTNLNLAEMLETKFPRKERMYLVKEDHLPLGEYNLTSKTF